MNREMLVAATAERTGLSKRQAEDVLIAMMDIATEALASGDCIRMVGFGTLAPVTRAARKGTNPQTGKPIKIKACKIAKFTTGKALKEKLNSRKRK